MMVISSNFFGHIWRYFKFLFISLVLVFSIACTKIDLGYTIASKMIKGRIYDTYEFKPKNKKTEIDIYLNEQFEKNKSKTLNELSLLILDIQKELAKENMTAEAIAKVFHRTKIFRQNIVLIYNDVFSVIIKKIEKNEIEQFRKFTQRQIAEETEGAQDETEFFEKKEKNFKRTINFLMGDINDKQLQVIQVFLKKHKSFFMNQISFKKQYFQKFDEFYPDYNKMLELTLKFYSSHESVYSSKELAEKQTFENSFKSLLLEIWNYSDNKQKKHFKDTIAEIQENLKNN